MLEKLQETSIEVWSYIGDIFSAIFGASDTWFPIISYIVISILSLFLLKKILDKSVSTASSLTLSLIWTFLKKLIVYVVIISIVTSIVISLYFYLESLYSEYDADQKESARQEQGLGYLLR